MNESGSLGGASDQKSIGLKSKQQNRIVAPNKRYYDMSARPIDLGGVSGEEEMPTDMLHHLKKRRRFIKEDISESS